MDNDFEEVDEEVWAYKTNHHIQTTDLVKNIISTVSELIYERAYEIILNCEPSNKTLGYKRVFFEFPVDKTLYDQFFNGRSGYRAQYYLSKKKGKAFDRSLIEAIVPLIVDATNLYEDKFSPKLCQQSLAGRYSKFWFSKQLTDPVAQAYLVCLAEEILPVRWKRYWEHEDEPHKGLLAPPSDPEGCCSILLNGTFINPGSGKDWDQKPDRSEALHNSGWT